MKCFTRTNLKFLLILSQEEEDHVGLSENSDTYELIQEYYLPIPDYFLIIMYRYERIFSQDLIGFQFDD